MEPDRICFIRNICLCLCVSVCVKTHFGNFFLVRNKMLSCGCFWGFLGFQVSSPAHQHTRIHTQILTTNYLFQRYPTGWMGEIFHKMRKQPISCWSELRSMGMGRAVKVNRAKMFSGLITDFLLGSAHVLVVLATAGLLTTCVELPVCGSAFFVLLLRIGIHS